MYWFLYSAVIGSILLIFSGIYRAFDKKIKNKAFVKHHELSWKLTNTGAETRHLNRAKACYEQLTKSYEGVENIAGANEKSAFEDDIEMVRDNAEMLAESAWSERAEMYLLEMMKAYSLLAEYRFDSVERAYCAKEVFLKAYDAYFDCTQKFYEHNRNIWKNVDLWDEALKCIAEMLDDIGLWKGSFHSKDSVRHQIEADLTKRTAAIRSEYLRKLELKDMIFQKIAENGSIQKSLLFKMSFAGFVDAEIQACYKGLVKDGILVETKSGSESFVTLSK